MATAGDAHDDHSEDDTNHHEHAVDDHVIDDFSHDKSVLKKLPGPSLAEQQHDLQAIQAGRTLLHYLQVFVCETDRVERVLEGMIDQAWGVANLRAEDYRTLSRFGRELANDCEEAARILAARTDNSSDN